MPLGIRDMLLVIRAKDQATRTLLTVSSGLQAVTGHQEELARKSISTGNALLGIGTVTAAIGGAAVAGFGLATKAAIDYNKQAALTYTQVREVGVSIEDIGDIGVRVAKEISAPFKELQPALYDIFSSMNVNVKEAEVLLKAFAKSAVAGQTDVQSAGRATIAIMNAFKIPISDVNKVMDIQFAVVRSGTITYEEFASVIGRAIPSATRAGQSIEVLGGMMAFLTRNGLSAAMAATSSARAFDLFANPKFAASLEELGVSVADVHGKFRPLPDVIVDIKTKFGELNGAQKTLALLKIGGEGSVEAFDSLGISIYDAAGNAREFSDISAELAERFAGLSEQQVSEALGDMTKGAGGTIQAMRFLNLAIGDNTGFLQQLTSEVQNSAGAQEAAYKIMADTPAQKLALLKNRFEVVRKEIGDALIPSLVKLSEFFLKLINVWESLDKNTRTWIVRIAAVVAVITVLIGLVTAIAGAILLLHGALALMNVSLALTVLELGLILGVFIAVGVGLYALTKVLSHFGISWGEVWEKVKEYAGTAWQYMQQVWDGITQAATAAWQAIQPVWQGIQDGWDAITRAASSAWQIIQQVWDGITQAAVKAWQSVQPIWQGMQDAWDTIVRVAVSAWQTFQQVWDGISSAAVSAWQNVIFPIFTVAKAWFETLVSIILGFWRTWVEVVWAGVSASIEVAWAIIKPIWDLLVLAIQLIIATAQDLFNVWKNVVWDPMVAVVQWAWETMIKPMWDALVGAIRDVIIPILNTLWQVFQDVWDTIVRVAVGAWQDHIQPAWDSIVKFANDHIIPMLNTIKSVANDVFDAFGAAAKRGFEGAQSAIGIALRAIGTLVSGFLRIVGNIAGVVNLENIKGVLHEAADAAANWGYESGGVLKMARGGVPPFITNGIRAIVGEGNPAYPEYVIPTDPKYRGRARGLFNDLGPKLMASGGTVPMLAGGGIIEGLKDAFGTVVDAASWTLDKVRQLAAAGLEKLWIKFDVPNHVGGIPPAAMNSVRQAVIDIIAGAADEKAKTEAAQNVGSGQIANGWQAITNWLTSVGEPYTITSTVRPGSITSSGNLSLHATGQAVDMVSDDMMRLFNRLLEIGSSLQELFYDPAGWSIKNGVRADFIVGGHSDHVHAATFDNGGILKPGFNLMYNGLGVPELLYSAGGLLPNPMTSRSLQDAMTYMYSHMTPGGGLASLPPHMRWGVKLLNEIAGPITQGWGGRRDRDDDDDDRRPVKIDFGGINVNVTGLGDRDIAIRIGDEVEERIAQIVRGLRSRGFN